MEKEIDQEAKVIWEYMLLHHELALCDAVIVQEQRATWRTFILVTKPYMERRAYATFRQQWPEGTFTVTSRAVTYEEYCHQTEARTSKQAFIETMVGDLQRIKTYPSKGYQIEQDIPERVWQAYEYLVGAGFTKYVV